MDRILCAILFVLACVIGYLDDTVTMGIFMSRLFGFIMLFLPAILAFKNDHWNKDQIFLWNVVWGWAIIGWFVAMYMFLTDEDES